MRQDSQVQPSDAEGDVRRIPMWARRYAQNRAVPFLAGQVAFLLGFAAMGGLSYGTAWAYVTGNRPLAAVFVVLLAAFVCWWTWFSFIGMRRFSAWVAEVAYRREGAASIGPGPETAGEGIHPSVGLLFGFCILVEVGLGVLGFFPIRYQQPLSALYVVPFLLYLGAKLGQAGSPFLLLWPVLYGLHAILLVAGAPIYFSGKVDVLNMLLPTVGYGMLSGLAAHLYSRIALRRLRALAAAPDEAEEEV